MKPALLGVLAVVFLATCGNDTDGDDHKDCSCDEGFVCHDGACLRACGNDLGCLGVGAEKCDPAGFCAPECDAALGYCSIDGVCYLTDEPNPENVCQICDSLLAAGAWSANDGASCTDGLTCTEADACLAGACAGVAKVCDDGVACTVDSCVEDSGCTAAVPTATCVIAGVCYAQGDEEPGNDCRHCDAASSKSAWTALSGVVCDDGQFCTEGDHCDAGTCVFANIKTCNDGSWCTVDGCDEHNDVCTNPVADDACLIGGECYLNGEVDPTEGCQDCQSDVTQVAFTADDANACDDGAYCTVADHCSAGICASGADRDCDDDVACTDDVCDESGDACHHALVNGSCMIDGVCVAEGTAEPDNPCRACAPTTATGVWTADDTAGCDDQLYCTVGDYCTAGRCQFTSLRSCADSLWCTNDSCNESTNACDNQVAGNACLVEGVCYADGAIDAGNPCRACVATIDSVGWTNDDDNSCSDGSYCTVGDHCVDGVCAVTGNRDCDDGLACTTDTCSDSEAECMHAVNAGSCVMDGACYSDGAVDPDNPCRECRANVSQTAWSNDDSNDCEDDLFCTEFNHCQAGSCVTVNPCSDGIACTDDRCDEATDTCTFVIFPSACLIGGVCVHEGEPNPGALCEMCNPSIDNTEYSALTPVLHVAAADTLPCVNATLAGACIYIEGTVSVTGTCTLEANLVELPGQILANGTGYPASQGPGVSSADGGGASYGGVGGYCCMGGPGPTYGAADDRSVWLGSGGRSWSAAGGAGGGAIAVSADGIRVSGTVRADGAAAANGTWAPGGGSGGSVVLMANRTLMVSSTAQLTAKGGNGGTGTWCGGGGGGGRIKLFYAQGHVDPSAVRSAAGGIGGKAGCTWQGTDGTAGTVFDEQN